MDVKFGNWNGRSVLAEQVLLKKLQIIGEVYERLVGNEADRRKNCGIEPVVIYNIYIFYFTREGEILYIRELHRHSGV